MALLIGNLSYQNHPQLKAPMVDVYELTNLLQQLNFQVVSLLDLTESEMRNAVDEFLLLLHKGVYGGMWTTGNLDTCPKCKFSSSYGLFFSAQVCCTTPATDTRTMATVSWFLWMRQSLTAQQTVYVCRASLSWCRRKRRDSTCFCWTCAERGGSALKQLFSYVWNTWRWN